MGIALFSISALFAPLQELVTRLVPAHQALARRPSRRPACPARTFVRKDAAHLTRRALPLRVVRTLEAGIPAGSTGRMVISGRMADVCAELERLAALEAAQEGLARQ